VHGADAWPITDCTAFCVAPAEIIAGAALCRVTWAICEPHPPSMGGALTGAISVAD
jgi:hypothetical protein